MNQSAFHNYLEQAGFSSFEGEKGMGQLSDIAITLGYHGFAHFLADNPGAQEVIIEWIADHQDTWKDELDKYNMVNVDTVTCYKNGTWKIGTFEVPKIILNDDGVICDFILDSKSSHEIGLIEYILVVGKNTA